MNQIELCRETRTIILSGAIEAGKFKYFSTRMAVLESEGAAEPITVEIYSEGGCVYEALAIIGRMKNSPCKVITIGYGQVMSCALCILAAGNERLMHRRAWGLYHEGETLEGQGSLRGRLEQLKQDLLEEEQWIDLLVEFTETPKELWVELSAKESYLTAEQCLQYGIVDRII